MANQLGTEKITTTLVGVINSAKTLGIALGDGFQITDITALFAVVPNVKQIIADGRQAVAEFLDLTDFEALTVAQDVARLTGAPQEGVIAQVNHGLSLLARTYGQVKQAQYLFEDWKAFAKTLAA